MSEASRARGKTFPRSRGLLVVTTNAMVREWSPNSRFIPIPLLTPKDEWALMTVMTTQCTESPLLGGNVVKVTTHVYIARWRNLATEVFTFEDDAKLAIWRMFTNEIYRILTSEELTDEQKLVQLNSLGKPFKITKTEISDWKKIHQKLDIELKDAKIKRADKVSNLNKMLDIDVNIG